MKKVYLLVCILAFLQPAPGMDAFAMYMSPDLEEVPVERVVGNLEAKWSKASKGSNESNRLALQLGRVHSMAYVLASDRLKVQKDNASVYFPHYVGHESSSFQLLPNPKYRTELLKPAGKPGDVQHLKNAIKYFEHALGGDPKHALARLGAGWAYKELGDLENAKRHLRELVRESPSSEWDPKKGPPESYEKSKKKAGFTWPMWRREFPNQTEFSVSIPVGATKVELRDAGKVIWAGNPAIELLRPLGEGWTKPDPPNFNSLFADMIEKLNKGDQKSASELASKIKNVKGIKRIAGAESVQVPDPMFQEALSSIAERGEFAPNASFLKEQPNDCYKLRWGTTLREGYFSLTALCLIWHASKKKDLNACRLPQADERAWSLCVALMAKSHSIPNACEEFYKPFPQENVYAAGKQACRDLIDGKSSSKVLNDGYPFNKELASAIEIEGLEKHDKTRTGRIGYLNFRIRYNDNGAPVVSTEFQPEAQRFIQSGNVEEPLGRDEGLGFTEPKGSLTILNGKSKILASRKVNIPTLKWPKTRPGTFDASRYIGTFIEGEAATYLVQVLDPQKDKAEIESVKDWAWKRAAIYSMTSRAITPLAIPDQTSTTPAEIYSRLFVDFDLDGSNLPQKWSWINPNASWLIYVPPKGARQLASGRFLFGSVTFWNFWRDGFEALCSLDDDGDTSLRGTELRNLHLWKDANSDGKIVTSELTSINRAGFIELSCKADYSEAFGVHNLKGARTSEGGFMPIYDLVLTQESK